MSAGRSPARDTRLEAALLGPGEGMCLHPLCYWRPLLDGIEIGKQCQCHTGETTHPTAFKIEKPLSNRDQQTAGTSIGRLVRRIRRNAGSCVARRPHLVFARGDI